jgi:hypothetical protein
MSARPSLFAKIRAAALSLGRSERTATRKARLLGSASFANFVRLTPDQNVKLGYSPKARHYALKGARITKATPTISARQFEEADGLQHVGSMPLSPDRQAGARPRTVADPASANALDP